ncbi:MAG: PQQ-dependent dehydrogenase, methanol/ethanol family [Acidobacteriaceae bacterium]
MALDCREGFLSVSTAPPLSYVSSLQSSVRHYARAICYATVAGFALHSLAPSAHAQSPLPDGPGKATVERMCTTCHGLNVVTGQRMTKQGWADQVDDMVSRGAVGTDAEIKQVVEYLSRNFGKEKPPLANAEPAPAAENRVGVTPALPTAHAAAVEDWQGPTAGVTFDRILNANQEPQNWLTFGGTYRSLHYSLLDQIKPENARDLELKWVFQARFLDPYETTPLVVDGVLYTMQGDDVVALDATTGRLFWIYKYTPVPEARLCCGRISRGLAILGDTLYMAAVDAHLIAIDAKTGHALWDTAVAQTTSGYTMTDAPLIIKNKVIVGVAGGEYGIRGFIVAYNAHTGKEAWRFYTTAGPGDPGRESWGGDSWKHGGGSIWTTGSYDPETNLTYWGVGNAGPDYNGDVRRGDNLYTSSLVALDADTGQLKWHYQANPHNEFDWDAVQVPLLADIAWHGKPRKVILWADRNGFFYVLDRTNGEFLLGRAFVKQTWNAGFEKDGRPIMSPNAKSTTEGTLIFPDNQGGTNWFNPSFSPRTKFFYLNARENYSTVFYKGPQDYEEGSRYDGRGRHPFGVRAVVGEDEDKYTAVRALDPQTGECKWQFKLNTGNSLHTFEGWQTAFGAAGILTTATDVLFTGGREGTFVALDARNGSLLWKTTLGGPMIMNPITYAVGGKQYIAVNAGSALFVFGLR